MGEIGVGGGAEVPCEWTCGVSGSISVSEPDEISSSSQESTTSSFFGLDLVVGFLVSEVWRDNLETFEEMSDEAASEGMLKCWWRRAYVRLKIRL